MRISTIRAYLKKEFLIIFRSRLVLMIYIMPSMILLLFGYGIKMEVSHTRSVIIDYDQTPLSFRIASAFEHSRYFDVKSEGLSEAEALRGIKQGQIDLVVIIPESFEKKLLGAKKTAVALYIDGSFPSRASSIEAYARGMLLGISQDLLPILVTVSATHRSLFNQAMRDAEMIIPGLIGLVLLVSPAILSALLIVREKEEGTIFNFYSSPVIKGEFLIAKLLPVLILHSVNVIILFLWAVYLFEVPFRGSFLLYLAASAIYLVISLSVGLLVSIVTSTQIVAIVMTIIITIIPGFLYSGMLMPIGSMKGGSYIEAHIYPVMYYTHLLYDLFLVGEGLSSAKNQLYLLILVGYAAALLGLGTALLKKGIR